jgi:hypothetical protein
MNAQEGWQLVPVEPTPEMERNAWTDSDCRSEPLSCKRIYKAMLAAAPTPPAQDAEPVAEVRAMDGGEATIYYAEMLTEGYILPHGTKLYTHAPSDKLRQAAEEAIKLLEDSSGGYCREAANLRAALEGKS